MGNIDFLIDANRGDFDHKVFRKQETSIIIGTVQYSTERSGENLKGGQREREGENIGYTGREKRIYTRIRSQFNQLAWNCTVPGVLKTYLHLLSALLIAIHPTKRKLMC
ncbi:hypothetical protein KQX54_001945 [Cotesia glomerata]|uniref:Uncharacterized protein n=1 Tax=Cotesia glomerata TaxID=32391 RepID=A0AAV7IAL0_COTGL|nr:hypothetical protein KQX54_001945 [Cotesia glomerata]